MHYCLKLWSDTPYWTTNWNKCNLELILSHRNVESVMTFRSRPCMHIVSRSALWAFNISIDLWPVWLVLLSLELTPYSRNLLPELIVLQCQLFNKGVLRWFLSDRSELTWIDTKSTMKDIWEERLIDHLLRSRSTLSQPCAAILDFSVAASCVKERTQKSLSIFSLALELVLDWDKWILDSFLDGKRANLILIMLLKSLVSDSPFWSLEAERLIPRFISRFKHKLVILLVMIV